MRQARDGAIRADNCCNGALRVRRRTFARISNSAGVGWSAPGMGNQGMDGLQNGRPTSWSSNRFEDGRTSAQTCSRVPHQGTAEFKSGAFRAPGCAALTHKFSRFGSRFGSRSGLRCAHVPTGSVGPSASSLAAGTRLTLRSVLSMYAHAMEGSARGVEETVNRLVAAHPGDMTDDTALRSTLLALRVRRHETAPPA